jgi:shikimate dehydrogenase
MHDAASAALGLDRVYIALHVRAADLPVALRGIAVLGFQGANVTLPHKRAAAGLCSVLTPAARAAGVVNTLTPLPGGGLEGHITDGLGLVAALADAAPGALAQGATVLGAGGTARAAGAALLAAGAGRLTVVARRREAADELAAALGALAPGAEVRAAIEIPAGPLGAVVHATPAGGIADLESQPLPADAWERMDAACDYAYRPDGSATPLVREAAARSLPVVDGLELLVRQGALSFTRWTGLTAPLDAMRAAVRP